MSQNRNINSWLIKTNALPLRQTAKMMNVVLNTYSVMNRDRISASVPVTFLYTSSLKQSFEFYILNASNINYQFTSVC